MTDLPVFELPQFKLSQPILVNQGKPTTFQQVLQEREYSSSYGSGVIEDLHEKLGEQQKLITSLMMFLMGRGLLSPEDACAIVNTTTGFRIEVVNNG